METIAPSNTMDSNVITSEQAAQEVGDILLPWFQNEEIVQQRVPGRLHVPQRIRIPLIRPRARAVNANQNVVPPPQVPDPRPMLRRPLPIRRPVPAQQPPQDANQN